MVIVYTCNIWIATIKHLIFKENIIKKLFKDIRHNDIEAVKASIAKTPAIVSEYFDGKSPKKDIGQSSLQVAVKCGCFEIIELLLENGADVNFMENPEVVPPHSTCMPVLHDVIIGAMDSLLYYNCEASEKYVKLAEVFLEKGADPNKEAFNLDSQTAILPIGTLVTHAKENLSRYNSSNPEMFDISKNHLFKLLDLLKKYGADMDRWFYYGTWGSQSCRAAFLDDFVPQEDKTYEVKYHGRIIKGVDKGNVEQGNSRSTSGVFQN